MSLLVTFTSTSGQLFDLDAEKILSVENQMDGDGALIRMDTKSDRMRDQSHSVQETRDAVRNRVQAAKISYEIELRRASSGMNL